MTLLLLLLLLLSALVHHLPADAYTTTQHGNLTHHHHNGTITSLTSHHHLHAQYNLTFIDNVVNLNADLTVTAVQCNTAANQLSITYATAKHNNHTLLRNGTVIHGGVQFNCVNQFHQPVPFYYRVNGSVQYDHDTKTAVVPVVAASFWSVLQGGDFTFTFLNNTVTTHHFQAAGKHHRSSSQHLLDYYEDGNYNYNAQTGNASNSQVVFFDQTCSTAQCTANSTDEFCQLCNDGQQPEVKLTCDDCYAVYDLDLGTVSGSVGWVSSSLCIPSICPQVCIPFTSICTPKIGCIPTLCAQEPQFTLDWAMSGTIQLNMGIDFEVDDQLSDSGESPLSPLLPIGTSISISLAAFEVDLGAFVQLDKTHDFEVASKGDVQLGAEVQIDFSMSSACLMNLDNIGNPGSWCTIEHDISHSPLNPGAQSVSLDADITVTHGIKPMLSLQLTSDIVAEIDATAYLRSEIDFSFPAYPALASQYYNASYLRPSYWNFPSNGCSSAHYVQYQLVAGLTDATASFTYDIPVPSILSALGVPAFSNADSPYIHDFPTAVEVPIVSGCLFPEPATDAMASAATQFVIQIAADAAAEGSRLLYKLAEDLASAVDVPQYRIHVLAITTNGVSQPVTDQYAGWLQHLSRRFQLQAASSSSGSSATVSVLPSSDGSGPSTATVQNSVQQQISTHNSAFYQSSSFAVPPPAPVTTAPTTGAGGSGGGGADGNGQSGGSGSDSSPSFPVVTVVIGAGVGVAVVAGVGGVAFYLHHRRALAQRRSKREATTVNNGAAISHSQGAPVFQSPEYSVQQFAPAYPIIGNYTVPPPPYTPAPTYHMINVQGGTVSRRTSGKVVKQVMAENPMAG